MIKTLLISSLLMFTASFGVWIKTDGTELTVPCPDDFSVERLRLPLGCTAEMPGVWLSVDRYREMEVELAEARATIQSKAEQITALEARVSALEGQLLVCTAVPECPACPNNFFQHTMTGAAIGTVISLGGCAAWTLSR